MLGQADASMFILSGDKIFYLAQSDQTLHSIIIDGTEDKKLGDIKAITINVVYDKILLCGQRQRCQSDLVRRHRWNGSSPSVGG